MNVAPVEQIGTLESTPSAQKPAADAANAFMDVLRTLVSPQGGAARPSRGAWAVQAADLEKRLAAHQIAPRADDGASARDRRDSAAEPAERPVRFDNKPERDVPSNRKADTDRKDQDGRDQIMPAHAHQTKEDRPADPKKATDAPGKEAADPAARASAKPESRGETAENPPQDRSPQETLNAAKPVARPALAPP